MSKFGGMWGVDTELEMKVVELIQKNHPEYRGWVAGNVIQVQEAVDILALLKSEEAK